MVDDASRYRVDAEVEATNQAYLAQPPVRIRESIGANTAEVLDRAAADNVMPRRAADAMAEARVRRAMGWRRWR